MFFPSAAIGVDENYRWTSHWWIHDDHQFDSSVVGIVCPCMGLTSNRELQTAMNWETLWGKIHLIRPGTVVNLSPLYRVSTEQSDGHFNSLKYVTRSPCTRWAKMKECPNRPPDNTIEYQDPLQGWVEHLREGHAGRALAQKAVFLEPGPPTEGFDRTSSYLLHIFTACVYILGIRSSTWHHGSMSHSQHVTSSFCSPQRRFHLQT